MILFLVALCAGVIAASRLDNTYLPPVVARTNGLRPTSFSNGYQSYGRYSSSPFNNNGYNTLSTHGQYNYPGYGPYYGNSLNARSNIVGYYGTNIIRYNNDNNGNGNYQFDYETDNQIKQQEIGYLKNDGYGPSTAVQGAYSYVAPNGQTITVNYVADENGFQPSGDHIPLQKSVYNNRASAYRQYYNPQFKGQYLPPTTSSYNTDTGYKY